MAITLKTEAEIEIMREGGRILGQILQRLKGKVEPGLSTLELDQAAERLFKEFEVVASFKGYRGYPAHICTAINQEVVHAIPRPDKILKSGNIISIDAGVFHRGFHTDSAITVPVGEISQEAKKFIQTVKKALDLAIETVKPGKTIGDIGHIIQKTIEKEGYSAVRDLIGHGIGQKLHEEPQVPNFGRPGQGPALKPGLTIAIEPIINQGQHYVKTLDDKWTVVTQDGLLSCQIEHTVAVTNTGAEVLTLP